MPRGGPRVGAGRPKGAKSLKGGTASVKAILSEQKRTPRLAQGTQEVVTATTPLQYMVDVMNDVSADALRRDRMAVSAAPYLHPKVGEGGKKEERNKAAKAASKGRFAPAEPPRLVVSNA